MAEVMEGRKVVMVEMPAELVARADAAAGRELQRERSEGWSAHPNLRLRPHAPAAGRGRCRSGGPLSATVCCHRVRSYVRVRGDAWRRRHRWSVIRVLDRLCHRVGRAPTIGRPWLWRLKPENRE
jgi:hypothetical protein